MKRHYFIALAIACLLTASDATTLLAQNNRNRRTQKSQTSRRKIPASRFPGQFPESSERLLTDRDVEHQTSWGMRVMMNEIYARHGYVFKDADLRKHFRREKWYKGTEKNLKKIKLTDIEIQNIAFIKDAQLHPKI